MSYPALTIDKAQELAQLLRNEIDEMLVGGNPFESYADEADWVTERPGEQYERSLIEKCGLQLKANTIESLLARGPLPPTAGYVLEAQMAGVIHGALRQCKMDMLEDEDFWRYLALFPFRWYLVAREPELKPQDFGGYSEIIDEATQAKRRRPKSLITQLIYRTYLWGKIAYDEEAKDRYARATVISDIGGPLIDIWHSHLIRTQLGQLGKMPHAFIDVMADDVNDVSTMKWKARETEKLIARIKHNVLFDAYRTEDAKSIIREQLGKVD